MLGKTRQAASTGESFDPQLGKPRGVLRAAAPSGIYRHTRRCAAPELAPWVEHYWMVFWDLREQPPFQAETLPHPNVHVVFEKEGTLAWGVSTRKFSKQLEGKAHVFGIKFTPGGFFPFLGAPVSTLADSSVPATDIFGPDIALLEETLLSTEDEERMVRAADSFLLRRMPSIDAKAEQARRLVERILREPDILTVEDLAARTSITARSLQRLFNQYVGVSPKWVIRRYRLHELLERIHSGEHLNFAALAVELGYFDQAHLVNDFKSIVGYAPVEYSGRQRAHTDLSSGT